MKHLSYWRCELRHDIKSVAVRLFGSAPPGHHPHCRGDVYSTWKLHHGVSFTLYIHCTHVHCSAKRGWRRRAGGAAVKAAHTARRYSGGSRLRLQYYIRESFGETKTKEWRSVVRFSVYSSFSHLCEYLLQIHICRFKDNR